MAGHSKHEFNAAVRECLSHCYQTDIPVAALAEHVELLKQRDWTPSEIHKVEAAVTKILLAISTQTDRDELVRKIVHPRGGSPVTSVMGDPALRSQHGNSTGRTRS